MKYKSKKREIVINYMRSAGECSYSLAHISDVCEPHGVGKSTVYRIISELVDEGAVRKITDAKTRHCTYQYVGGECRDHLHLQCVGCGKLIHLDHEVSESLCGTLATATDFSIEAGGVLYGKCAKCTGGEKI